MRRLAASIAVFCSAVFAVGQSLQTTNIQLALPNYAAPNWNLQLNPNFQKIDSAIGLIQVPYVGAWSNSTNYQRGQQISYGGSFYTSVINANFNNTPSTGSLVWQQVPYSSGGGSALPSGPAYSIQAANSLVSGPTSDPLITLNPTTHQLNVGGAMPANTVTIGPHTTPLPASWTFDTYSQAAALQSINGLSTILTTPQSVRGPLTGVNVVGMTTPEYFSAYGDAVQTTCTTTAASTAVTCVGTSFVAGDVGKTIAVHGAGALSGSVHVALITTISTVSSSTAITVAAAATISITNAASVYGHDDTAAIQSCWSTSSTAHIICRMTPATGTYLALGQLIIKSRMNVQGAGSPNGTVVESEYNGDQIVIDSAPVQGVTLRGLELLSDPSQPNSRGFHIQGIAGGPNANGGLWDSTFDNIEVDNPALECMWLDGGGGAGYAFNLPNQFLNFNHFNCNGPAKVHPANLIRISGQVAQVKFIGGQTNGDLNFTQVATPVFADYTNPLVELNNKSVSLNDGPGAISFDNYTIQNSAICMDVTWGFGVSYAGNGYLENCGTGATGTDSSVKFDSITLNNIVTGFNFTGSQVADVTNNVINNSYSTMGNFGTCTNANFVSLKNNSSGHALPTTGCSTVQQSFTGPTLTVQSRTVLLNGDSGANPITKIIGPHGAGEILTLLANGQYFLMTTGTGSNISYGNYSLPLEVDPGSSVTLGLDDLGATWQVLSVNSVNPAGVPYFVEQGTGSTTVRYVSLPGIITSSTSTSVKGLGAVGTAGIAGGSNCNFVLKPSGTGSQYFGSAFCEVGGSLAEFHASSALVGSLSWVRQGETVANAPPSGTCSVGVFPYVNTLGGSNTSDYFYCDVASTTYKAFSPLTFADLQLTTTGTNCAAPTYSAGVLNIPLCTPGGGGTVTSLAAPSASWPAWLVPTVTNPTTTASLAVAASPIPNSALANAPTINGSSGPFTFNGREVSCTGATCTFAAPFPQHTYYLSTTGLDTNAGGFATPWLSPNHALNCGDVVIALPGTYTASNFASGKWGAVTCPNSNGVAWLQCQTFDACKISSGAGGGGILVSASYWGVQGWEVTNSGNGGACFGTTPPTTAANIHHIIFANDVANGCGAGGFSFYNHGAASVDYVAAVGDIAYNAAQNNTNCYSGFSVFQPIPTDTIIGTHIYFGWDYAFGNIDPNPCAGTTPTDGNGFIYDSFDGANPGGGTGTIYTQLAVMENNISVDNGGRAWEFQTYTAGTSVTHGTTIIQNITGWGNQLDPNANYAICTDGSLNIGYGVLISKNIDMTTAATACTARTLTGINIWDSSAGTTAVVGNLVFTASGTNIQVSNGDGNTGPSVTNNTTGTNPLFAAAANPGAPSCTGKLNVADCMSTVISNFTPSATASMGLGYQPVSNANGADPYFPQWLCRAGLPAGIVTKSCQ